MQPHTIVQNDVLSIDQAVRADAVDLVGRRRGSGSQRKRGLSTHHISPFGIRTPIALRSSVAKTGESAERFIYDRTNETDTAGCVMVSSPADSAVPTHTTYSQGKIEIWHGGSLVRAKHPPRNRLKTKSIKSISHRGRVGGFSKSSRRRLMLTLGKIKNTLLPAFVTLTYPGDFPHESAVWKRDLDVFFKRMKRKFTQSSGVWKMEPQKRGAPHFHIFVWGAPVCDLRAWVSLAWYQVVGSGDERHLRAGTQVKAVESWRGVRSYSAKYIGKAQTKAEQLAEGWLYPGRWWGVYNADALPWAQMLSIDVPRHESILFLRTMRRYAGIKSRDFSSLSILVNDATWWAVRLLHIPL